MIRNPAAQSPRNGQPRPLHPRVGHLLLGAVLAALPVAAVAQETRTFTHPDAEVRLTLPPELSAEDRAMLEIIAATPEVLTSMLENAAGHAAIALAPGEGMMQDGAPPASATALGGLPDAATAQSEALGLCEAARRAGPACVVVLELAPR